MRNLILFILVFGMSVSTHSQTSENNQRLKRALAKFPQADANKDGVLTLKEAMAFKNQHSQSNRQSSSQNNSQGEAKKPLIPNGGKSYVYKTIGKTNLSLYLFNPTGHQTKSKAPAIVFFHGGGWKKGSPAAFQHHCKYLAARGMVAITVEYRVSSRHPVKVEDCIEDAKSAMRWVRGHAEELGIDPNRIASGGGSAGGHLAACLAVIDDFDSKSDDKNISPKPNAMVLFNPFLALENKAMGTNDETNKRTHGPIEKAIPFTYASKKQPPCIIFFGTEDRLLKGAERYLQVSKIAGNKCEIITYEGQGHGFFNHKNSDGKYYNLTVNEMDMFLTNLGWLAKKQ